MPLVSFTSNLRRHVDCPELDVEGATVATCLRSYFALRPMVQSYVLDEQGAVRRHVAVFVGDTQIIDPRTQSDPVAPGQTITVMQALSGG